MQCKKHLVRLIFAKYFVILEQPRLLQLDVAVNCLQLLNNYPAKSRGISSATWPTRP